MPSAALTYGDVGRGPDAEDEHSYTRARFRAFGEDADAQPLVIDHHGFVMDQSQFTQELQLSGNHDRIDWTTGPIS